MDSYIQLDERFPALAALAALAAFDPESNSALAKLSQVIMRRDKRGLLPGERELIAAWTSKLNNSQFCFRAHAQAAKILLGEEATYFLFEEEDYHLPPRLRSLLVIAVCVQESDYHEMTGAMEDAKHYGATDEELHDTVLVASLLSMVNRYVDGLNAGFRQGEPEVVGTQLVKFGYVMTWKQFFQHVLPQLWSGFWSAY